MAQASRDASFSFRASEWSHQCCRVALVALPRSALGSAAAAVDLAVLHRDALAALAHAPTAQLRGQLSSYARVTGDVAPTSFLDGVALSNFDGFANTHLSACGIRPIGHQ